MTDTDPEARPDAMCAVTVNVGGGPGNSPAREAAMSDWAVEASRTRQPAFVFAQEVPSPGWIEAWGPGYRLYEGVDRHWRIHSALLVRSDLAVREVPAGWALNLRYHGSYLAAVLWTTSSGEEVIVASVHASPDYADPETYGWQGELPPTRFGGNDPRYPPHRLWDSDMVLATLGQLATRAPVLAAGDFNESRLDDFSPDGTRRGEWAQEYFERARGLELSSPLLRIWGKELPTRAKLQLDHVLLSDRAATLVPSEPGAELDSQWAAGGDLSDHTAVWFALRV